MTMERLSRATPPMIPRRGATLMEMMVVISMMAVTLPAVTIALAGVTKAVNKQRREDEAARIAERLVHQFRSDVHQSQGPIDIAADKMVCRLAEEIEVTYTLTSDASQASAVDRIERSGPQGVRRKSFLLAPGQRASFSIDRSGKRPIVALRIASESKSGGWRAMALAPATEETP